MWRDISTGPKSSRDVGHGRGRLVWLLIPYSRREADVGYWDQRTQCWRFTGDDGPHDVQPTHWAELGEPPV